MPSSRARKHWRGRIHDLEGLGDRIRVRLESSPPLAAEVTATSVEALDLTEGREVIATVNATEIYLHQDSGDSRVLASVREDRCAMHAV